MTVPLALALVEPTAWRLIADATHAADGASAHGHDGVAASGPAAGRIVAAVNFTAEPLTLGVPDGQPERATLVMSTDPDRAVGDADLRRFVLLPNEAVLLLMPVVAAGTDPIPARPPQAADAAADPLRVP